MIPIRPINEELNRLHQPVITAEEDSRWDTALQGFSVTSCVSRPETASYGGRRHSSNSLSASAAIPAFTPPLHPTRYRQHQQSNHNSSHSHHRHHNARAMVGGGGRSGGNGGPVVYHNVIYPVNTSYGGELPVRQSHGHHHHAAAVVPQHHHHHYYVHQTTSHGSPGAIPRVSW